MLQGGPKLSQEIVDDFGLLTLEVHFFTVLIVLLFAAVDEMLVSAIVVKLLQVFAELLSMLEVALLDRLSLILPVLPGLQLQLQILVLWAD